jgi:SIR2-like domain
VTVAVPLFELAAEIARIHQRSQTGAIAVLPVIVDDLASARPVLRAVCETLSGRLLDAADPGSPELHAPVPATADTARRGAVEGALATPGGRRVALRDVGGGLVDVAFEHPSIGAEQSAGDRAVAAFARAAIHKDLDECDFAIIAYESSVLDLPFKRALWQLAVEKFAGMPHGTLRTLVVVTEAAIDIELHCQTGKGFSLAITDERLLRRHGRDDLMANVSSIKRHSEAFVLFLGAGFSQSSKLPLGNALRDGAIRRLLGIPEVESPTSTDLAIRFHQWLSEKPGWLSETEQQMLRADFVRKLTLERVVSAESRMSAGFPTLEEFLHHHDSVLSAPGGAVLDLASVLVHGAGRIVIVEVNFDLLIERHATVPVRVFASDQEFREAPQYLRDYLASKNGAIPVLKMHGTITDFRTCVVTEEQAEHGVGADKLRALRELLSDVPPRLWIYIGVSMRDRDILRVLKGDDFARGMDERWVCPYLVDTVAEYANERAYSWATTSRPRIEDRLITETADAFFLALREVWEAA